MDEEFETLLDDYASVAYRGALPDPDKRQSILDYVKRLEANQITPEMEAIYLAYKARVKWADGALYPSEMGRFHADLWIAFARVMDKGEG